MSKYKVQELKAGKWVDSMHVIETTKDATKDSKTKSDTKVKKVLKTVNISDIDAKSMNVSSKEIGIKYVKITKK